MSLPLRVIDAAAGAVWAIEEDWLRLILDIASRQNVGSIEAVAARTGRPLDNARTVTVRQGVAVLPVRGPIFRYANLFAEISGATSVSTLAKDLTVAVEDPSVRAILLEVDSPGGEVDGIQELAGMIANCGKKKHTVAYVSAKAASGAYWLASACDEIISAQLGLVGSIGCVATIRDRSKRDERDGITTYEFVSSVSPKKRPDLETESGREQIQTVVDAIGEIFVADVARYRNVSTEDVLKKFGQGGVMLAEPAMKVGMIDSVGTFEDTVAALAARDRKDDGFFLGGSMSAGKGGILSRLFGGMSPDDRKAAEGELETAVNEEVRAARADAERQVAEERRKRLALEAEVFVDAQVRANRVMPAERNALVAHLVQAQLDDERDPRKLVHGDGNTRYEASSRADGLRKAIEARSSHSLTQEMVPGVTSTAPESQGDALAGAMALKNGGVSDKDDLDRVEARARSWAKRQNGDK